MLGSTYGPYIQQLDADAQYLAGIGADPTDYLATSGEHVTQFQPIVWFRGPAGQRLQPLDSLASATDAQVATPGLPLGFARTFATGTIQRNQFGRFGWGWTDSWSTSVVVDPDGTVNVFGPGGTIAGIPAGQQRGLHAQPGDHGTLAARSGGGYALTEKGGQVTAYNTDGSLGYVQDTNANRITAGYTGGLLTSLTASSGQSLTLGYNAAGLVSTITDSAGRTTSYNYDPTNQYLTSVVDFNARTTSYTYDTGTIQRPPTPCCR